MNNILLKIDSTSSFTEFYNSNLGYQKTIDSILGIINSASERINFEKSNITVVNKNEFALNININSDIQYNLTIFFSMEETSLRFSFFVDNSGELIDKYFEENEEDENIYYLLQEILSNPIERKEFFKKNTLYKIKYIYSIPEDEFNSSRISNINYLKFTNPFTKPLIKTTIFRALID